MANELDKLESELKSIEARRRSSWLIYLLVGIVISVAILLSLLNLVGSIDTFLEEHGRFGLLIIVSTPAWLMIVGGACLVAKALQMRRGDIHGQLLLSILEQLRNRGIETGSDPDRSTATPERVEPDRESKPY